MHYFWLRLRCIIPLLIVGLIIGFVLGAVSTKHSSTSACSREFHYAYFSTKSFYDDAYKNADVHDSPANIKAITLNHHLLAPHLIAESINAIATTKPVTVLLVSPNHFAAGHGQIISSMFEWDTPYGKMPGDCNTMQKLQNMGALSIEEKPFIKEHGISGIVAFVKRSLPNAKIIPLIVKETTSSAEIDFLVKSLHDTLTGPILIIGSFDFSHYVSAAVAEKQDEVSIKIMKKFDFSRFSEIHVDSVKGLELLVKLAKRQGASSFTLLKNTNSAEIAHDKSNPEVTSYVNGFFK